MVELAELLVERVAHADWAIFAKNGTDATTIALMVARAADRPEQGAGRGGAYHGAAPWATLRMDGVAPEERANLHYYAYNDIASVERAIDEAGAGNVAAIITSPFRHDAGFDQEVVDPAFARRLRGLCDELGAALVLDEVRAGFRLNHGGSWEPLGVAAGPQRLEQGHRERLSDRRDPGQRPLRGRRVADLRHRLVLVPGGADGGGHRDDQGACATRTRSRSWSESGRGCGTASSSLRRRSESRSGRPARCRCRI